MTKPELTSAPTAVAEAVDTEEPAEELDLTDIYTWLNPTDQEIVEIAARCGIEVTEENKAQIIEKYEAFRITLQETSVTEFLKILFAKKCKDLF